MPSKSPRRSRGRAVPGRRTPGLMHELGLDMSWPVFWLTVAVLAVGFGPLLLADLLNMYGRTANLLIALGPTGVCVCFAVLTYVYGSSYAPEFGWSRLRILLLTAMFLAMSVLVGWGLFVSL